MLDIPKLEYFKAKNVWSGSNKALRCRIFAGEQLMVAVWDEPFEYNKTPEDKKTFEAFEFSENGLRLAREYLNKKML